MSDPIYTLGYAHWSIDEVSSQLQGLDAVLVDVRHRPHTTKPGFDKPELEARFGDRYVHVPAFGNVNYQGGPVELAHPGKGIQAVRALDKPLVLMCGCRHPNTCHRSTVARLLSDRLGPGVKHLQAPGEQDQPDLFDDAVD